MSHLRSLLVVVGAAAIAVSGCGGGGGDGSAGPTSSTARPVPSSTTAPPATIDVSEPIPAGSLHGTPRPPLENTGDDYVAIVESLIANFRWLTENPNVAALDSLYVPGTDTYAFQVGFFSELTANGWRSADEGYNLVSVDVVDVKDGAVSLRFSDAFEFERIVNADGVQVGEGRPRDPVQKTWNVLLTPDAQGRWRFADVHPADAEVVEL